jgi:hypothetical protein
MTHMTTKYIFKENYFQKIGKLEKQVKKWSQKQATMRMRTQCECTLGYKIVI